MTVVQPTKVSRPSALRDRSGLVILNGLKGWLKGLLYTVYTRRLRAKIAAGPMPQHIAVVMDGNRRYAERLGMSDSSAGYWLGTEKVNEFLRWNDTVGIPVVTLWILSLDNMQRETQDLHGLMDVLEEGLPNLRRLQATLRHPRRIKACGRTDSLPQPVREALQQLEHETAGHGPYTLNIAVGYGGREEIVDAVKELLRREANAGKSARDVAQSLTPEAIGEHLYFNSSPDPDLIIRTSGEVRMSGFMLWESVYSEYYFCDALWPAFRELDFLRAIRSYQDRKRRFGQ